MAKRNSEPVAVVWIKKSDSRKTILEKVRHAFEAEEELRKLTVLKDCIPATEVVAELEALDRQARAKKKRKSKHAR